MQANFVYQENITKKALTSNETRTQLIKAKINKERENTVYFQLLIEKKQLKTDRDQQRICAKGFRLRITRKGSYSRG